ncbi:type VI secretion system ImpG/VasA family protein [Parazoarcus communis]|uniref:Type VI secretion system ImpG/VasA family protein n=1 Tax=Parazoarcus communis TaxID=41977 RepID=A0A2U8H5W2_9RHOO|nr:type VI secretion system baseplate subunit TssF [Parazoarcus communis]AWI81028.1 type VI secretion system ImpG/VasA family protein [Parazoarcus communis]
MKDLLPHYERELAFLRTRGREFAERYPKIASRLMMSGEGSDDPHVERMIESFALLSARVSKRLEDSYPEFAESLLSVLYPHYLRPFPSCSIACFQNAEMPLDPPEGITIPRGTTLKSRAVNGAECTFRTAWDVSTSTMHLSRACFSPVPSLPARVSLPPGASAMLSLDLRRTHGSGEAASSGQSTVRLYIDAAQSVTAALRDALFLSVAATFVECDSGWRRVSASLIEAVGFRAEEALVDYPSNVHDGYRYLTEYFAFPEKFSFFDLCLGRLPPDLLQHDELTLHFALSGLHAESDAARLLQGIDTRTLRTGCVPVVNLFPKRGEPIRLSGQKTCFSVIADARRAFAYEVASIDSVHRVSQSGQGEQITEFRPFFSLRHGERAIEDGNYWISSRNAQLAEKSPGHETGIAIVESAAGVPSRQSDVLSVALTCTNRDLPTLLPVNGPGAELIPEGGLHSGPVRLLRRPTASCRFDHQRDGLWRLVSHLSLNHLSISGSGLQAFREMLCLYDLPRTTLNGRKIDGIKGIENVTKTTWLNGKPFACFVRGIEVRITIDEDAFVGSGLDVFARVMDCFLGLYVHLNSFVQVVLVSSRTAEELIRCKPRSGESILG